MGDTFRRQLDYQTHTHSPPPPPPETFRLFLNLLVFHCLPVCPAFSLHPFSCPLDQSPAPSISSGGGPTCGDASVPPLTSARLRLVLTSAGEDVPPSAPLVLLSAYLFTFISHSSTFASFAAAAVFFPLFFASQGFSFHLCFLFVLQPHEDVQNFKSLQNFQLENISNLLSEAVSS